VTTKTAAVLQDALHVALEKEAARRLRSSQRSLALPFNLSLTHAMLQAVLLLAGIGGAITIASYGLQLFSWR
jgi:hypothetical protein